MNWEYILEIPFESKGLFYTKSDAKYKFKGKNYFLLNKNGEVLRDFALIDGTFTYRENDNKMKIGKSGDGTSFWKSRVGEAKMSAYRSEILTDSPINCNIKESTPEMTDHINAISIKYANTSLFVDKFITGSNSTGSDAKISAAPLICVDEQFYGMRHINSFKNLRVSVGSRNAYKKYPITEEEIELANKLDLSQYFDLFPENKKEFYKFNPEMMSELYLEKETPNEILYFIDYSNKQMSKELKSYQELMKALIEKYENRVITKDKLANRLRGLLRPSLLLEKRMVSEPVILGIDDKESNLDAAHLVEVSNLKSHKVSEWWKMGDVNNGLLLPKNIHWKFDKDKDFVLNDDFIFSENGKKTEYKINPKYINEPRKKYLKERYSK